MFFFASSEQKKLRQDVKNQLEICYRSFEDKSQDKYKKAMQFISKLIQNNNQDIIQIIVDNIKATIKDEQLPPVRKYQAIRLLRDLMKIQIKNKNKALGKYVLKKIFKRLTVLASHNAGSNEEDRGRDIFKNVKKDQEKYSILFLNELLIAIQEWAKTWPGVSDGMKKQFNQPYKQLLTNGVKFPKEILKAPQPQGYRGDETNRNSQSPYNSVPPKSESLGKKEERNSSQIRSISIEQKPAKKPISIVSPGSGKLDNAKVKKYFNSIIPPIEQFLLVLSQIEEADPDSLSFLNDMIEQVRKVISEGNSFCTQLSEEQMENDPMGKIVLAALRYSQKASNDIKKLSKKASQFDRFKEKFVRIGSDLIASINNALNPPKEEKPLSIQKPTVNQKVQTSVPKVTQVNKSEEPSSNKLSVPRVSSQNAYNSISGPGKNWVIKERQQYHSNSHRDENENHEKFGSFGIGGIGQKVKNQASKSKEKSAFANKSQTQRPSQNSLESSIKEPNIKKPQTLKNIAPSNHEASSSLETQKNKQRTFGPFKDGEQNSHTQLPNNDLKRKNKKQEQVKDEFNDSGFKQQHKVQLSGEQKAPNDMNQSGGFFGDFDKPNPNLQFPRARNQRRLRSGNVATKQIAENSQNPFENPFGSQVQSQSNNFSAFNHQKPSGFGSNSQVSKEKPSFVLQSQNQVLNEKPSAFGTQSQVQNEKQTSLLKPPQQPKRKQSFNDPFQNNSFELNKSGMSNNQRNSFDDKNPNFWQNEAEKSNSDNRSQRNRSQIQNPFETQQLSRRNQKSINPFEEDNKSEVSQKNKSSVLQFQMNKSFTKSERSNPFQTTSNNLNRTNQQVTNPFEQTSKDDFKPKPVEKFQSVSQQGSFKKVDLKNAKISKNTQIDNPFETMTEHKSIDMERNQQRMNESVKFSVKENDQNYGFDFDQFGDISKAQRDSINTSSFANPKMKTEPNDLSNSAAFGNKKSSVEKAVSVEKQKSIHFSQFGQPGQQTNRSKEFERKENSKKSINFSDFGDFNDNKAAQKQDFEGFSGFNDTAVNAAQDKGKNNFDAFEVSKTSNKDFFRQTEKSQANQKPQDSKSRHSGFSGFNMNADSKSEKKEKSSVDWNDFDNFDKGRDTDKIKFDDDNDFKGFGSEMRLQKDSRQKESQINTDRSQEDQKTQKRFYNKQDLKLQFSEDNSKYQSPQFNQKYDSVSHPHQQSKNIMSSLRQVQNNNEQSQRQSIALQDFAPVQKRGYEWNPLGIRVEKQMSRIFTCSDNELQAKRRQLEQCKMIYNQQKGMMHNAKEVYNQARKVYLQKVAKVDLILKQKQSYKKILMALSEVNHNKESQIFAFNQKIKEVSHLKQKILEKEKLFFEKTKIAKEVQTAGTNYRPNHNKWEIFNRNLKMMREREMEGTTNKYQSVNNYSKTGYVNSRYY